MAAMRPLFPLLKGKRLVSWGLQGLRSHTPSAAAVVAEVTGCCLQPPTATPSVAGAKGLTRRMSRERRFEPHTLRKRGENHGVDGPSM